MIGQDVAVTPLPLLMCSSVTGATSLQEVVILRDGDRRESSVNAHTHNTVNLASVQLNFTIVAAQPLPPSLLLSRTHACRSSFSFHELAGV